MTTAQLDRNLLVGILALQMDFINRDQLIAAMQTWLLNKQARLEDLLLASRSLRQDTYEFLTAMVAKHLEVHGNDAEKSLAAVSSIASLQRELQSLHDENVDATLNRASVAQAQSIEPTVSMHGGSWQAGSRFRVLRPHAQGGLGQVSVALDVELNREVALKEIQPKFAAELASRQRFLVEAEITGRLEHPSVVPVYSLGQFDDGRPFYVMRFIRGDSLHEAIAALHDPAGSGRTAHEWQLGLRKLLGRFLDVCNAIEYAHSRGILHRDLKPGNIMLGKYGETLVVDWGLAKAGPSTTPHGDASEAPLLPQSGDSSSATVAGSVIGTPAFMSPEQAEGRLDLLGPPTDVYSLGATLYCLLTNKAPFPKAEREQVLSQVRRGGFSPPRKVNPNVPRPLDAVCLKAMALRCGDRYPTPRDLAEDVERWLADEPVSVYREPWTDRVVRAVHRHRTAFVGTAVLLACVLVCLAVVNGIMTRKNAELRVERDRANQNSQLAVQQRKRAENNLATSRALTLDLLNLAETELSQIKGKEQLRRRMTQQSATLFREFYRQSPDDRRLRTELAQVLRMEANVSRMLGDMPAAAQGYAESIRLLEELRTGAAGDRLVSDRLAETLRDQGNLLRLQGQLEAAARSFARGRDVLSGLLQTEPTEPNYRRTLATLDVDLADLESCLGRAEESLQCARSAVAVFREFSEDGSSRPADPILWLLASCREGDSLLELDRNQEAEAVFNDAVRRIRKRLTAGPERNAQYLLGRALTGMALARIRSNESATPAAAWLEESLAALKSLVDGYPSTAHYPRFLASAWNAQGEMRLRIPDAPAASVDFERAVQILSVAASKPDVTIEDLEVFAKSLAGLGEAARAQRQLDLARAKWKEAVDVLTQLTSKAPGHERAKRRIRQLQKSLQ